MKLALFPVRSEWSSWMTGISLMELDMFHSVGDSAIEGRGPERADIRRRNTCIAHHKVGKSIAVHYSRLMLSMMLMSPHISERHSLCGTGILPVEVWEQSCTNTSVLNTFMLHNKLESEILYCYMSIKF